MKRRRLGDDYAISAPAVLEPGILATGNKQRRPSRFHRGPRSENQGIIVNASQLCSAVVVSADESTPVPAAAAMMRANSVGAIVVRSALTNKNRPKGIVTDRDIVVRAVAVGLDLDAVTIGDLCWQPLEVVDASADLESIVATMKAHAVRRLLVMRDNEMLGVISLDDVLMALGRVVDDLTGTVRSQLGRNSAVSAL